MAYVLYGMCLCLWHSYFSLDGTSHSQSGIRAIISIIIIMIYYALSLLLQSDAEMHANKSTNDFNSIQAIQVPVANMPSHLRTSQESFIEMNSRLPL